MNTVLHEIWPCLLVAALLGTLLGWWLRRCKKRKVTNLKAHEEVAIHKYDSQNDAITLVAQEKDNVDDETIALHYKISKLEQDLESSKIRFVALEDEYAYKLKKKEQSFYDKDSVVNTLKKELSQLKEDKEREKSYLISQKEESSKVSQEAQKTLNAKDKELNTLSTQLRDLSLQSHYHETEIQNLKENADNLQKEKEQLHRRMEETLKEKENSYRALEKEKSALLSQLASQESDYNNKFQALSTTHNDTDVALHSLQQKLEASRDDFEKLQQKNKESEENLQNKLKQFEKNQDSKQEELQERLTQALAAETKAKRAYEELEKEKRSLLEKIQSQESDYNNKFQALSTTHNDQDATLHSLQQKLEEAEKLTLTYSQEKDMLLENDLKAQNKLQELEKNLQKEREEKVALQAKMTQALESESDAKKAYEASQKEKLAVISKLESADTHVDAQEKLVQVTMNNLKYRKEIEELEAKVKITDSLKIENKELKKELNAKNNTNIEKPEFLKNPQGKADNLQRIKGIGDSLEPILNDLGIYHFKQIAAWKPHHVAWVDGHLAFAGRIEKEEWIKQAKALMQGKDTDFSKRVKDEKVHTSDENTKSKLKRHKHKKRLHKK